MHKSDKTVLYWWDIADNRVSTQTVLETIDLLVRFQVAYNCDLNCKERILLFIFKYNIAINVGFYFKIISKMK